MGTLVIGWKAPIVSFSLALAIGCGSSEDGGSPMTAGSAGTGASSGSAGADAGGNGSGGNGGMSMGKSGAGGTGGTAPAQVCAQSQPFGPPIALDELNTSSREAAARFTGDELTVVFYARLPDDDGVTDSDLYIAERASVTDAFSTPVPIALSVESLDEMRPWISADGLTLLYDVGEAQSTGSSTERTMSRATRATREDEFELVAALFDGESPYVVGDADGTLYFSGPIVDGEIRQAPLSDWMPGSSALVMPSPSERPLVTSDGLTLYFATGPNYNEIHRAQRADTTMPFGDEMIAEELVDGYAPSWLSPDGCRLYYDRDMGGEDLDIVMVERQP